MSKKAGKSSGAEVKTTDVKIENIHVEFRYTDAEIAAFGREGAQTQVELASLESQFDAIKSDYKAKIESAEFKRNSIGDKINRGFEMRPCECVVQFNQPKKGRKSYWKYDDTNKKDGKGEFVREEDMTQADFQADLFDKKPKTDTVEKNGKESLQLENPVLTTPTAEVVKAHLEIELSKKSFLGRAIELVVKKGKCSTSFVQKSLGINAVEAVNVIDEMERRGIVSPANGPIPREVLITDLAEALAKE